MRILIKENNGISFSIAFPNWLVLNKLGIGFLSKTIARSGKLGISIGSSRNTECEVEKLDKRRLKREAKKIKRAVIPALREFRAFVKRNPNFVLVEVDENDGDNVTVTL